MSIKYDELRQPGSCLSRAAPDEPIFVLRGKDKLFAQTVRLWAAMAVHVHEPEKISEAIDLANFAESWRADNVHDAPAAISAAGAADVRHQLNAQDQSQRRHY